VTPAERPAGPVFANTHSDRVTAVRRLAGRSSAAHLGDRVVAEGPQSVREAADAGAIVDLWITPEVHVRWGAVARAVTAAGGHVHPATPEVLHAMSPSSQGVLAIVRWPEPALDDVAAGLPSAALVAVFEEIRDPGNAGTVIRAADAAGADAVIFTAGSIDPRATKVIRSSAGSFFHLPVVRGPALGGTLAALRSVGNPAGQTGRGVRAGPSAGTLGSAGLQILAADAAGPLTLDALGAPSGARPVSPGEFAPRGGAVDSRAGTVWVFGNEARGLSAEAREAADGIVRIPVYGRAESLNVAMAATLCLYESARARRQVS
jgi:TrmH family RNA methyltransferase